MIQTAAQPGKKIPVEGDYAVVARAAELCNPFLDALGEVTLVLRGPVAASIVNWNSSLFRPLLQPVLLEVLAYAAEGGSFEISAFDCRLDAALPAMPRQQSRAEGKRLVRGLMAPRGDRLIERYRTAVLAGDTPGHLAVIHALRAAVFYLPPQVLIASYLVQEGIGAGLDGREISQLLLGSLRVAGDLSPDAGTLSPL